MQAPGKLIIAETALLRGISRPPAAAVASRRSLTRPHQAAVGRADVSSNPLQATTKMLLLAALLLAGSGHIRGTACVMQLGTSLLPIIEALLTQI